MDEGDNDWGCVTLGRSNMKSSAETAPNSNVNYIVEFTLYVKFAMKN
jgi:hypothetical protein